MAATSTSTAAGIFLRTHPELGEFVLPNVVKTDREIGRGSYGSVVLVKMPGASCAAKLIHPDLMPRGQTSKPITQFVEECKLMSTLRHPHIVQFLGITFIQDSRSRIPALVMELMMTSLHEVLDPTPEGEHDNPTSLTKKVNLPLGLKFSILHDIAQGLVYLHDHTPRPIIHRDLSARNILLNSAMVAKIADLGVARIVPHFNKATMTKTPGAFVYMPPEALLDKSRYDVTIDIFSFGVIAIFLLSEMFPEDLSAPNYEDEERGLLIARTELERRSKYMEVIYKHFDKAHSLVTMIKKCLQNSSKKRLNIHEAVQCIEEAMVGNADDLAAMNKLELIQTVQEMSQAFEIREAELSQAGAEKDQIIQSLQKAIQDIRMEILRLKEKSPGIPPVPKPRTLKSKHPPTLTQIPETEDVTTSDTAHELDEETPDIDDTTSTPALPFYNFDEKVRVIHDIQKRWAPQPMERGSSVTHGSISYFAPWDSQKIFKYDIDKDEWTELPMCPYQNSSLAIINGLLVAVGGQESIQEEGRVRSNIRITNKVLSYKDGQWVECLPPMLMRRASAAIVHSLDGRFILVIGGLSHAAGESIEWVFPTTLEVFDTFNNRWTRHRTKLPRMDSIAATLVENTIYVTDRYSDIFFSSLNSFFHCNLKCDKDEHRVYPNAHDWSRVANKYLVEWATPATVSNNLILIGGQIRSVNVQSTGCVFKYDVDLDEWTRIGNMQQARHSSLVSVTSGNRVVVVGGRLNKERGENYKWTRIIQGVDSTIGFVEVFTVANYS